VIAVESELAQTLQRVLAGFPRRRRIDDQQCPVLAAEIRGDHQQARSRVAFARGRRKAQEVQVFDVAQREQSGAAIRRPDQVVVRQGQAVVAVRIRVDVTDGVARARSERAVGTRGRHGAAHAHEHRFLQRMKDVASRAGRDRQPAEYFLVLDVLRARRAHALHDEVEAVLFVDADVVVIDRDPQQFARARAQRFERQGLRAARQ
jgi:hypothetical protein